MSKCVLPTVNRHDSDSQNVLLTTGTGTHTELGYFFLENATREALIATPGTGTSKKGAQLAEDWKTKVSVEKAYYSYHQSCLLHYLWTTVLSIIRQSLPLNSYRFPVLCALSTMKACFHVNWCAPKNPRAEKTCSWSPSVPWFVQQTSTFVS